MGDIDHHKKIVSFLDLNHQSTGPRSDYLGWVGVGPSKIEVGIDGRFSSVFLCSAVHLD